MFKTVVKEQLVVPAHVDYLADIRDFVAKIGHKHGFSTQAINAFKLSIDEATTNIIKHSYRDWDGSITLRAIIKRNSITFILLDQGKYFDPRRVKAPDLQRYVKIGKKGGLGIFIMRRLLDDIDYRKTEEGNELRLVKKREVKAIKRIHVPSLSLSLKARYSGITCGILTAAVLLGYFYLFFKRDDQKMREVLNEARPIATNLVMSVSSIYGGLEDQNDPFGIDTGITTALKTTVNDNEELVFQAFLVDTSGVIINHHDEYQLFNTFSVPADVQKLSEFVSIYPGDEAIQSMEESPPAQAGVAPAEAGVSVIDFAYPARSSDARETYGTVHMWIKKSVVDRRTAAKRFEDLRIALMILVIGFASTFVLIYIVLNPFRKLATWVRRLGHEEVEDEMDIDESTEVGEIAKAFTDITTKLRQSQKNLAEQERLQKEMQVAQEIQRTLLPTSFPDVEGYSLASFYEAAKEVGGDYFDFVEVDRDTLGIAVADVSGKGVPGSLVMTMIRTALRTEARGLHSASEVLCRVNDFVMNDMKKGMFVTLFYVIIDSRRRRINYASAGHNPMILYRGATEKTYYLNPRGFPLGIALPEKDLFRKNIESDTIKLAADDILILYTDGITEAMNPKRDMFGDERFLEIVRKHSHLPVESFVDELKDELHSFTEGNVQNDDITLVAIKEQTSAEQIELDRAKRVFKLSQEGKSIREACERVGLTLYAYNKYKEQFEKGGVESVEVEESDSTVEAKHLSIEEKTKIFDIIRQHPEFGAKRIAEELATETYGFEEISEARIYEELVRSRLNTRKLREAFIARRGSRKRMKTPGTPLLTLDGRVIIKKHDTVETKTIAEKKQERLEKAEPEQRRPEIQQRDEIEPPHEARRDEIVPSAPEKPQVTPDAEEDMSFERLLSDPIENLLQKKGSDEHPTAGDEEDLSEWSEFFDEPAEEPQTDSERIPKTEEKSGDSGGSGVDFEFELAAENIEEWVGDEEEGESDGALDQEFEKSFDFEEPHSFWEGEEQEEYDSSKTESPVHGGSEEDEYSFNELLESMELDKSEDGNGNGANDFWKSETGGAEEEEYSGPPLSGERSRKMPVESSGAKGTKVLREKVLIKGLRYYKAQQYDEAIREIRRVVEAYPDFKEAHSILGNAYFRNKMFLEALQQYEKVKEIDPTDPDAYENIGVIYANRGEFEKAIKEWETILQIDPDRKDIHKNIEKAKKILGQ